MGFDGIFPGECFYDFEGQLLGQASLDVDGGELPTLVVWIGLYFPALTFNVSLLGVGLS
ncbi:MAG: hypothetical protein NVS3B5_19790 [Sphingomicrobium sp.]